MLMLSSLLLLLHTTLLSAAPRPPIRKEPQEQVPLPPWDHYLKEVSRITLHSENSEYPKAIKKLNEEKTDNDEEWTNKVVEAFEKLVDEESKQLLHRVKKKEVDAIRRRLIPRKKHVGDEAYKDEPSPTHLDLTSLWFSGKDIKMLITANREHVKKFHDLRENDFKRYEMEKRFLEEQRLRHIKTEEKRKLEQEKLEAEKAKHAKIKVKHPLTEDTAKEVWVEKEELPKDEFNPKTFFALNDLDTNGLLDLEEVRRLLQNEMEKSYDTGVAGDDKRERREEMERMREHIYKEIDTNGDLMIDFDEFMRGMEDKKDSSKNWETIDNESFFNETEFDEFEKDRIDEIREDIAEGRKPEGYEFDDVPLLDGNFLNETHIRYEGELFHVDDTPVEIRKKAVKEFYLYKKFQDEQQLEHIQDPVIRAKTKEMMAASRLALVRVHLPLSHDQLMAVWREQDHMNDTDFSTEKFFHLHDIDGSGQIDKQELRLMLITELRDAYKEKNKTLDKKEFEFDLESMKDNVFTRIDTNKDGTISLEELIEGEKNKEDIKEQEQWYQLHEDSEFTDMEFLKYKEEKILGIRKMIADGVLPENYNYNDVPLLNGDFINVTHVMRDGSLLNIHEQETHEHRVRDFKRARMESKFKFEESIKLLAPEKQAEARTRAEAAVAERRRKRREERKKRHQQARLPLSEGQEREVWEKEDKMAPEEFDLDHYFRLHDVDRSGKWNRQEVAASLISNVEGQVPNNSSDPTVGHRREKTMAKWLEYVFKHGDLDKDGQLDREELQYLSDRNKEKGTEAGGEEDAWDSVEEEEEGEYDEEDYDQEEEEKHL